MTSQYDDEFIAAAGLERSGSSQRKSAAEKRLESILNTKPEPAHPPIVRQSSLTRNTSPPPIKTNSISREARQIVKLQDDSFVQSAGLERVSQSRRKSSAERLLEESLKTIDINIGDDDVLSKEVTYAISKRQTESPVQEMIRAQTPPRKQFSPTPSQQSPRNQTPPYTERRGSANFKTPLSTERRDSANGQTPPYAERRDSASFKTPPSSERRDSASSQTSSSSERRGSASSSERRDSIYTLKDMEKPTTVKGSRISSRTQNLFKQYEEDMSTRCINSKKEQTKKELEEVQQQYQNSVQQNERELEEQRQARSQYYANRGTVMAM